MIMSLTQSQTRLSDWSDLTCTKKDLHDPYNHNDVIIHLEAGILECKVKWTLRNITTNKASRGDGIPVELFQILKDDAVKVVHSVCQQIGKFSSGHRTGKGQFSFQSQRKAMSKNTQTAAQLPSSHTLANKCSNSPSQASAICEPWTSWCSSWL